MTKGIRVYHREEEAFHLKVGLHQVTQHQRTKMLEVVNQMTERELTSKSVDELATVVAERFSINVPVLDEAAIVPQRRDVDIDMSHMRADYGFGLQGTVKGTEIVIAVPFTGDAELFRVHASSHTMAYPQGRIDGQKIIFVRQGQNLEGPKVRNEFDAWLSTIKGHLHGIQAELGTFNASLKAEATKALQDRAAKFRRDDDVLNGLGFARPETAHEH